jgi:hypothetical protein
MFKRKTIFVVGAGASVEYHFPLGAELKDEIARLVDIRFDDINKPETGDALTQDSIRVKAARERVSPNVYFSAGRNIALAMPGAVSIDNFLESREGDPAIEFVGKLGIVQSILAKERLSSLFVTSQQDREAFHNSAREKFNSQPGSWLGKLCQILWQGVSVSKLDLLFENVSFVIFNYDRCVEHYLWYQLQQYFLIESKVATEILSKVRFHHPYGTAARLPWQAGSGPSMHFGGKASRDELAVLVDGIKTFTEQMNDDDQARLIEDIEDAEVVVFLGFGFIEQNMKLLELKNNSVAKRVYATAVGKSDDSCEVIGETLTRAFLMNKRPGLAISPDAHIRAETKKGEPMTASRIFDEYAERFGR